MNSVITGLSGFAIATIGAYIKALLEFKKSQKDSQHQELEGRYKVIILLIYGAFDFEKNGQMMGNNGYSSREDVITELKSELVNALLYSTQNTIEAIQSFVLEGTFENLVSCANSMRSDLSRGKLQSDSISSDLFSPTK
jgi:hypothetical protein